MATCPVCGLDRLAALAALRQAREFVQAEKDLIIECHSLMDKTGAPRPETLEPAIVERIDPILAAIDAVVASAP